MSRDNRSALAPSSPPFTPAQDRSQEPRTTSTPQSTWSPVKSARSDLPGLTPLSTSSLEPPWVPSSHRPRPSLNPDLEVSGTNAGSTARLTSGGSRLRLSGPSLNSGQAGSHQPTHLSSSHRQIGTPRSRAITPASLPGSAGSPAGLGPGGGGGPGGSTRVGAFAPLSLGPGTTSPATTNTERSTSGSPATHSPSSSQSSFSKISATQVTLLLDTISDREGAQKWENKAEKIRSLLRSNGQEVFAPFFRRAVVLNAPAIYGQARDLDKGSYKLLREQVLDVKTDTGQAFHIVDAVDTAREEHFRDFDLTTFITHFLPDLFDQTVLAIAFTQSKRSDLRRKAHDFLLPRTLTAVRANLHHFSQLPGTNDRNLALVIAHFATQHDLSAHEKAEIYRDYRQNLRDRFDRPPIMAATQLWRLPETGRALIDVLRTAGPQATSTRANVEEAISSVGERPAEEDVANALLFMVLSPSPTPYNVENLVAVLKTRAIDWNEVIATFDSPQLRMSTEPFQRLFNALLPIARDVSGFDIQSLWRGVWRHPLTQVSFLRSFLLSSPEHVSTDQIPNFRKNFEPGDYAAMPQDSVRQIQSLFDSRYNSQDAVRAIVEVVLASDKIAEESADGNAILQDLVQHHLNAFMLALVRMPRPHLSSQESFVERCFMRYLEKQQPNWRLILDALYAQSPEFTNSLCTLCFHSDPTRTELIYDRAEELGWTEQFLKSATTPLGLDLACIREKLRPDFDLDKYISDAIEPMSQADRLSYGNTLWKFLRIKADDEFRVQREQQVPHSVPLSLKAVFTFLWKMQDLVTDRESLKGAQTTCLQTYPRLMNYGTGFDDILERRSRELGNKLPEHIDKQMSELFGQMYRSEKSIRDMITEMTQYKTSTNPELQDLFCCIVHGLFDEYICYGEYPEEALEKTALLFGNIIRYRLLPPIPQDYGLTLIVDAVKDNEENSSMNRFGVEALLQISERLPEWPNLCHLLLAIPTLINPEIAQKAMEGVNQTHDTQGGTNGLANGTATHAAGDETTRPFQSLSADPASADAGFRDPDQKAQEKILFVINNLSQENMDTKLNDLQDVLRPEHHQWFAAYLVEQRARLEPNNQEMYLDFLTQLEQPGLIEEVVRETYASIVKMMNAQATIDSATERGHLKSLGGWLGSLTLAQDRPIKHKNIYFLNLLLEGFDSQRLVVVIPFTCKVLVQGTRSVVFKPPNPWLMEIVRLLVELYEFAELKLNLKFEIEVLCKDLGIDHKKIEPAYLIRARPQHLDEDLANVSVLAEGMEPFDELNLNGPMSRGVRERISPEEMMASFSTLSQRMIFPPMQGRAQDQELIKDIIVRAFEQAIMEIIAPVVERSITIASISTAQLVAKDYSLEVDTDRYRTAAKQMVKSLAGSLALVTCKEPLRMSVSNYIRSALTNNAQVSQDAMPSEGHIMMALNDNLDIACSYVEKAAEERALPEIEHVIEADLEERRRYVVENSGRDFISPNVSRWSTYIPDPYKQTIGGLNEPQRAVYEDFSNRVHGMNAGHIHHVSTDSTGRQIPDVLQEALAMPNLSTPANQPALPHHSPPVQQESRSHSVMPPPRMNGFPESMAPHDKIAMLIGEVQKVARTSNATRIKDMEKTSSIFEDVRQILLILTSSARPTADHLARSVAEKICHTFIAKPPQHPLEAELLAFLLQKLCMLSELIVRDVMRWVTASEVDLLHNSFVTAALVGNGLMHLGRIDGVISAALKERNENGLHLLSDLMDQMLFGEEPVALRADFANSIVALYGWLRERPDLQLGVEISLKLKAHGVPEYVNVVLSDSAQAKQDQMRYIFREWASLYENMPYNDGAYATFLKGLHGDQIINSAEDLALFLRLAVDASVDGYEAEAQSFQGSLTTAFTRIDALALLVVLLMKFQGDDRGAVKRSKQRYLEMMLDTLVLILNHHHEMRATAFNQRVFTRLFNSILHEYATFHADHDHEQDTMVRHFAHVLSELTPAVFPGFAYGWLCLLNNRILVDRLLRSQVPEALYAYRSLLGISFEFLGLLATSDPLKTQFDATYRAVLRSMYVIAHDYPDFVARNHVYLCARIPYACPQLRNVVVSAVDPAFPDEPDPLSSGSKIDHLESIKSSPALASDVAEPLEQAGVLASLHGLGRKSDHIEGLVKKFLNAIAATHEDASRARSHAAGGVELCESVVAWIVYTATAKHESFDLSSAYSQFLVKLMDAADDAERYHVATAIGDHIRFPSPHTHYACKLFLHLWGTGSRHDDESVRREVLLRVLLERLLEAKPHPWGMVVLFKELTENPQYEFWESTGFDQQPDLRQRVAIAVRGH